MQARVLLLLTLLSWALPGSASMTRHADPPPEMATPHSTANARPLMAQTGQLRSDRVVGFWTSSTGVDITLAYSGQPATLWIQVYPNPGRAEPRLDHIAHWLSDDQFVYADASGSRVTGRVESSGRTIHLSGTDGWRVTWTRNR